MAKLATYHTTHTRQHVAIPLVSDTCQIMHLPDRKPPHAGHRVAVTCCTTSKQATFPQCRYPKKVPRNLPKKPPTGHAREPYPVLMCVLISLPLGADQAAPGFVTKCLPLISTLSISSYYVVCCCAAKSLIGDDDRLKGNKWRVLYF